MMHGVCPTVVVASSSWLEEVYVLHVCVCLSLCLCVCLCIFVYDKCACLLTAALQLMEEADEAAARDEERFASRL